MHSLTIRSLATGLLVSPFLLTVAAEPQNASALYPELYAVHSDSTPIFQNITKKTANPLVRVLQGTEIERVLEKRDNGLPIGTCAPGTPCSNGACCSKTGVCGFSPDQCGQDNCISNCDAKAECGQYAAAGHTTCPINVCCSKFGFCGTTEEFCGTGCQSGFGGCGPAVKPSCGGQSATQRTIGYYEGWAATRVCDKRLPSDLDISGLTHINFAFAYFHPSSFEVLPMSEEDVALYPEFTALKQRKPSLKAWISIGGWAFNDATNAPNTQTAFSDMAGSSTSRQKFVQSLINFMMTWGFDGVDLDWEYPGADDRGGIKADTANFVLLLKDLKEAFAGQYGLSVTLPASYWYLRWFDLPSMQNYLDFFNIMTYDIHGVWDSNNKNTGPYVRPHTNLTEIHLGLDLLWRNNVDPSMVNMGIGWYGRSFTLQDPQCNKPGCIFSYGGKAGECTKSSGTLSNAEIERIISKHNIVPTVDREAGVKWITFDNDQWVSYDDGETMQIKMDVANQLCLGGTLIWSLDQDSSTHSSSNDLAGLGLANGVSAEEAALAKDILKQADRTVTVRTTCHWSACGEGCGPGYFAQTYAKGQSVGIRRETACPGHKVKTLCCATGTKVGTCSWHGWRGVGMPCVSNYCPNNMEVIAVNTNSYQDRSDEGTILDLTCNGGTQSYCCSGFVSSPYLDLKGQKSISRKSIKSRPDPTCSKSLNTLGVLLGGLGAIPGMMTGSLVGSIIGNICPKSGSTSSSEEYAGMIANTIGQGALGPNGRHTGKIPNVEINLNPKKPPQGKPRQRLPMRGRYTMAQYKKDKDCSVTYTCEYGHGYDEVCDNQRWAIDKGLGGKTVYHKHQGPRPGDTDKDNWSLLDRRREYYTLANARPSPNSRGRCEVDEFPMAALEEGIDGNYQVVRLINGIANGKQGDDWNMWISAIYNPCNRLRKGLGLPPPPVTWAFGAFPEGDDRALGIGEHFIKAYGFDSQTRESLCWATYTYVINDATYTSTVSDQGFRAKLDDPMFKAPYNWPTFNHYNKPPSSPDNLPKDVFDSQWWKREVARGVLQKDLPISAIYEAEKISMALDGQAKARIPTPTPALVDLADKNNVESQRPALNDIPVETGTVDMTANQERRKRHLRRHQMGYKHKP
ncbi:hypothetical protein BDV39DRAFT_193873 [Aspergillus sergii]|uniref:chitinase n=1 Tax=Aspergillus sergii TaxID=1034303 RepID=A0A5N6WZS9_9EURO|nr:hypothetical protein BDV39DRAFT_193873 [Aspergillus sergii]